MNKYFLTYFIFTVFWEYVFMSCESKFMTGISLFLTIVNFIFMLLCIEGEYNEDYKDDDSHSNKNS